MRVFERFLKSRTDGERVIGTYLYPICLLGEPDWGDRDSAIEVVATVSVSNLEILVTRMGGLFVRPPGHLSNPYKEPAEPVNDLDAKIAFEEEAAQAFNTLICELCLLGVISQPTSPMHISFAQVIDGHALITGASGGREMYTERSGGVVTPLSDGTWRLWRISPVAALEDAIALRRSRKLSGISATLPTFVAGAYALYSQRQLSEALADAWVACEQILNHLWDQYLSTLTSRRRKSLSDSRTYPVAVRLEILRTVGRLSQDLHDALDLARGHRNSLMHRAETSLDWATNAMTAMKMTLEEILGERVADPSVSRSINW